MSKENGPSAEERAAEQMQEHNLRIEGREEATWTVLT
jgi:hypothetical protein